MLFFGVFLRDTKRAELTYHKFRKSYQTDGPIDTKFGTRVDSSGNGYMPNQLNLKTKGGISGGFRG